MTQYWSRYCTQKNGIDHVVTFGDDDQCPFCKLANPTPPATTQTRANTQPQRTTVIDLSGDTPPARTSGGGNFASLGGPAAQDQRRKSILATQQVPRARPHAGSSALVARQPQGGPPVMGVGARRNNMNSQINF